MTPAESDAEIRSLISGSVPLIFQLIAMFVGIPAIIAVVHFSYDDFWGAYFVTYSSVYSGIVGLVSMVLAFRTLQKPNGPILPALLALLLSAGFVLQALFLGVPFLYRMLF